MNAANREMVVDLPTNADFLIQFARLSIIHTMLDHTLKMFIRTFEGLGIQEAVEDVGYTGSKQMRKRVLMSAEERLDKGDALSLVEEFLTRAEKLTARRNELLHSPIGRERDRDRFHTLKEDGTWAELPSVAELAALVDAINGLIMEMNHERLSGEIDLALRGAPSKGRGQPGGGA
jgi:hypothetical protein